MSRDAPDRVAFVVSDGGGAQTGNVVTAQRLASTLAELGVEVVMLAPSSDLAESAAAANAGAGVGLVHAFHLRRCGPRGVELADRLGVPLVASATGTDLARDVHDPARRRLMTPVIERAGAVICTNPAEIQVLRSLGVALPELFVVRKRVAVPAVLPAPASEPEPGVLNLLLVAHVRRVKNVRDAVRATRMLVERGVPARLTVLGDILDAGYAREVAAAAGGDDAWARIHRAAVPFDRVGGHYAAADVVLNTSDDEGGSNAVLEAMAHGRTVVASAVPGNEVYLGADDDRGVLYPVRRVAGGDVEHDVDALVDILAAVAADAPRRERLGNAAREYVLREHGGDAERDGLLAAYRAARSA